MANQRSDSKMDKVQDLVHRLEQSDKVRDEQLKNITKSIQDLVDMIRKTYITKDQVQLKIQAMEKKISEESETKMESLNLEFQKKETLNSLARKMIFSVVSIGGMALIGAIISNVIK